MNCPNCGRVVNDKANICPRCKTKIFHNQGQKNDETENTEKTEIKLDEKRLKKKNKVWLNIGLTLLAILLLIVLLYILKKPIINFASDISWLKWLATFLEELQEILPF